MSPPDRFDTEPIVAWRCWCASPDGYLVSPTQVHLEWPTDRRLEAGCNNCRWKSHEAPVKSCMCGIYGNRDFIVPATTYALPVLAPWLPLPGRGFVPVIGKVSLWGRVIEHTQGWRAQYAFPLEVFTPLEKMSAMLRNHYHIDAGVMSLSDDCMACVYGED